jgi:hypothetical protein
VPNPAPATIHSFDSSACGGFCATAGAEMSHASAHIHNDFIGATM